MKYAEFGQKVFISKKKYSFYHSNFPGTIIAIDKSTQSALVQWEGEYSNNINWWSISDLEEATENPTSSLTLL
jgi:hypothetical protein